MSRNVGIPSSWYVFLSCLMDWGAGFEPEAVIAGFQNMAMMGYVPLKFISLPGATLSGNQLKESRSDGTQAMRAFFDKRQLRHAPQRELHNGDWMDYSESPRRADELAAHLPWQATRDFGLEPIVAVHDAVYLSFLKNAWQEWCAAGRTGDAIPYTFPIVQRRSRDFGRIDAKLGQFSFDVGTPITEHSWDAAYWSAQTAITATDALCNEAERHTFALCRPPGHHAGRDYMGGYCYINNAAVAARYADALGRGPVAILDVDYHHGNGSQDIYYDDPTIFFASVHADPRTDFPFYWGHADECGAGAATGTNLNIPLPRGTTWLTYRVAVEQALAACGDWGARFLVLSFGADTFAGDPISGFALQMEDFTRLGTLIAAAALPTVIIMEGGYAIGDLAANVDRFLSGFDAG